MKKNKLGSYREDSHNEYEDSIQTDPDYKEQKEVKDAPKANILKGFSMWGKYQQGFWAVDKTKQMQTAMRCIMDEKKKSEVEELLEMWFDHKEDTFCQYAGDPASLAKNWTKLMSYKDKL